MIEELGVKPEIGRLLYVHEYISSAGKTYEEFVFEVLNGKDYLDTEKITRSHSHELVEIIWVSPTDNVQILPTKFGEDFKTGKIPSDAPKFIKN